MFCTKCGSKIPDGSSFCDQCGAMQENTPPQMVPPAQPYNDGYQQNVSGQAAGPKVSGKVIAVIAVVAVIAIAAVVFVKNIKPTVYMKDYLSISFEGYDTRGQARITFDTDAFAAKYEDQIKYKGVMDSDMRRYLMNGGSLCEAMLDECVDGSLDKDTMLSNGDQVTFTWDIDTELAETKYNVKLLGEDQTITVTGLTSVVEVDPFENIEIQYSGISPYGSVSDIINHSDNKYLDNVYYYTDTSGYLSNGDEVKIIAECYDSENYMLEQYGVAFSRMENTYTVDGLGSYVTELEQISDDALNSMKKQSEDVLKAYVANRWAEEESLQGMEYLGSYLLTPKTQDTRPENQLILVYKVTAKDSLPEYGISDTFDYYYTTAFEKLIAMPDGTVSVDLTDYSTSYDQFQRKVYYGTNSYQYNSYYYNGYETFDTMLNKNVTSKIDQYNYVSNVTQK